MNEFDEIIAEFLVESYENLDELDRDLIALEDAPDDRERLASIFRTVHSIKGTSGFLALPKLERVAHVGENLLVPLRDGDLRLNGKIADGLLGMVDAIRAILRNVESDGKEGDDDYQQLLAELEGLKKAGDAPEDSSTSKSIERTEHVDSPVVDSPASAVEPATSVVNKADPVKAAPKKKAAGKKAVANKKKATPKTAEPAKVVSDTGDQAVLDDQVISDDSTCSASKTLSGAPTTSGSIADSSVRIEVGLLDKLMNLVGELVLSRNQIMQFSSSIEDAAMIAASQRLNLITTELQEGVMKTRMQPIRNAWNKLPRVVRDLSASCGKTISVIMDGSETELDKTILEALKDPLTHIVRNSVDHGIETPAERKANGKPPEGTLWLRAFHEGGQVIVEIADDGGGINVQRVREKGIESGLVTADQAAAMSEREIIGLILLPGFSTAAEVTNVSGRGVGMDVVKTNIERIGGTLEIHSTQGKGTILRIKIPLTLAIVPVLIVTTGGDNYAIPQVSLLELVRLDDTRAQNEIEFIHDAPVYRLRGKLLPLVYLDEQLELRAPRKRHDQDETVNIVVLRVEDREFGLVVDAITDTQEIVVKPLGHQLKALRTYAGTTIMGDGAVSLILDVLGLAQKGNILTEGTNRVANESLSANQLEKNENDSLLIVDPGNGTRAAIQLSNVARLEEFDSSMVERSGNSEVVQYRGQILPLIHLSGGFQNYGSPDPSSTNSTSLHVVVHSMGTQSVGIIVGKIVDIVSVRLAKNENNRSNSRVIQDRVTEMVDLTALIRSSCPEFLD